MTTQISVEFPVDALDEVSINGVAFFKPKMLVLLEIKELACALGRSRRFVDRMKRHGFQMPGGKATVAEARRWLARNPPPCSRK